MANRPYIGILAPGQIARYRGREEPGKRPLVWGRDDAIRLDVREDEILIHNISDRPAFYAFAIVPAPVAALAVAPWQKILQRLLPK